MIEDRNFPALPSPQARFGMLTDQFGVQWMFNYEYPKS